MACLEQFLLHFYTGNFINLSDNSLIPKNKGDGINKDLLKIL